MCLVIKAYLQHHKGNVTWSPSFIVDFSGLVVEPLRQVKVLAHTITHLTQKITNKNTSGDNMAEV